MKFLKCFKIQLTACAVMSILAAAAVLASGLIYDEITVAVTRLYFAVHPAFVLTAISLEALFLVSPVMMNETAPDVFFRSGAETSMIAAVLCEVVVLTTKRQIQLMAAITMPYILLAIAAFAAGLAVIRAIKS